jgi:hypothetical protein
LAIVEREVCKASGRWRPVQEKCWRRGFDPTATTAVRREEAPSSLFSPLVSLKLYTTRIESLKEVGKAVAKILKAVPGQPGVPVDEGARKRQKKDTVIRNRCLGEEIEDGGGQ